MDVRISWINCRVCRGQIRVGFGELVLGRVDDIAERIYSVAHAKCGVRERVGGDGDENARRRGK